MLRATLKGLLARKRRLALTVISIVLGVGFVAGTFVLTDTMNKAFDQLFTDAAAGSDVVVRAEQAFAPSATGPGSGAIEERDPVPDALLPTVESVAGVASASGDVSGKRADRRPGHGRPDRRRRSADDRHELDRHEPEPCRSGRARRPAPPTTS